MKTPSRWRLALAVAALALLPDCWAQELEPRSYINIPVGINFLLVGGAYQEGDILLDPTLDIEDVDTRAKTAVFGYLRSFAMFDRSAKFSVGAAYSGFRSTGIVEGVPEDREDEGFTDPLFKLSVNLLGSPALELSEFRSYSQDTILGVSLGVQAPWGKYDPEKIINLGFNYWMFKPEVGVSQALGRWILEGSAAVSFYTDNTDFNDGQTRERDPLYSVQGHVIYRFMPGKGLWGAFDITHFRGGGTTMEGIKNDNALSNNRYGLTLSLPLTRRQSMKLYSSRGINSRRGNEYNLFGMAWQFRWGGGL